MGVIYTPLFTPRASVAPKGAHTRTRRRHRHTQGTPHAHDILRWEVQSLRETLSSPLIMCVAQKYVALADGALRVSLCRAALRVERDMEIYNGRVEKRNDDGTWPIEKLLKCRVRNGKKQYRVRWEV